MAFNLKLVLIVMFAVIILVSILRKIKSAFYIILISSLVMGYLGYDVVQTGKDIMEKGESLRTFVQEDLGLKFSQDFTKTRIESETFLGEIRWDKLELEFNFDNNDENWGKLQKLAEKASMIVDEETLNSIKARELVSRENIVISSNGEKIHIIIKTKGEA